MVAGSSPPDRQGFAGEVAPFGRRDWEQVRAILAEGLATGVAAFRSTPPLWRDWDAGHLDIGRLAARASDGRMLGWAALSPVPDT
ncbi:hypothetical protein [Constrictibacter sp. MBR-5]|uniref:hypothetical protein n=1 Tax=Constrictibacter sp. MBR-5 TaxID=3156467 RepID=UPI003394D73B